MERTTAERVSDPIIGRLLDGRYQVGPRIARGGMATVYEATDTRLDRTVAVKVMHANLGDDDAFSRRFRREAQAAAKLAHHNVVAVFDQGDDAGTLFLVMEYVPGMTLRDLISNEAPMSPVKALSVIEPVLSALASAHRSGMIHRDVKPENVLLADDGRVKVADFGLARAINADTQHTNTGVLIGTVSYLAPELVVDGAADARADVYAAGVMVYEMLTGEKPHQAESPIQVAYKHVHEDIPAPSKLVPALPSYVDALVARATARDTSLRPTDAGVLLRQVRRVRNALENGVTDDQELTDDLNPTSAVRPDPFEDTDGQMPRAIIEASTAAARDDVYDQEHEHTPTFATAGPQNQTVRRVPVAPEPRRSRRGPLLLVLLLVAALVVLLGGWYVGFARYTSTPGVINLSPSAAKAKVTRAGLGFKVTGTAYDEHMQKGRVLSTDPKAGSRVLKNGQVGAVLSLGPERHAVPALAGLTLDRAQAKLQGAKLSYGQPIQKYSSSVPKGDIIVSQPKSGTELRREAAVDLVVSKGRRPIKVPDFTGRSADRADKALTKLGLVTATTSSFSDTVDKGKVIGQGPSNGTLFKGDTVTLEVSKGPELVTVPGVTAMGVEAATQLLEGLGFKVETTHSAEYIGLGYVLHADPGGDTRAPKGSVVTLYLV